MTDADLSCIKAMGSIFNTVRGDKGDRNDRADGQYPECCSLSIILCMTGMAGRWLPGRNLPQTNWLAMGVGQRPALNTSGVGGYP